MTWAAFLLMAGLALPAAAQTAPLHIDVIVSQTGGFAFVGAKTVEALNVVQRMVNAGGGVNGRPIQFDYTDDQTSPVVAVQLANAAIARGAQLILGPISAAACAAVIPLVAKNGPLLYCFSPVTTGPPGSYAFSVGAGTATNNLVMVTFVHNKGWKRIGIIATTDASCRDAERQIDDAMQLPKNRGMQVVAREHFNPSDLSVSAQISRIKANAPQALLTCASGTVFGTVLHGIHDAGLEVPTAASSANMDVDQLKSYTGLLPRELYFAAIRGNVPDTSLGKGPVKDAQTRYFKAFRAAGITPEFFEAQIWDPAMLAIDALRRAGGNPVAAKLHAYIEDQHDWAGIAGIYYFRDNSQRGIGATALQVYRWDAPRDNFAVVSRPAGALK